MENISALQSHYWGKNLDEKNIRQQLKNAGIDARRLSKLTQLCLLAALPLQPHFTPNTSIYLGSPFSSPSKFNKLFTQLNEHQTPSPLDFMANINNAPTFQLAKEFDCSGNSVFLVVNHDNFFQPLKLALLDLHSGVTEQALVGWALENNQLDAHSGALWWLCSKSDLPLLQDKIPQWEQNFQQSKWNVEQGIDYLLSDGIVKP